MAEVETVTVSSKGQVTIPSKLRRQLGIGKGERLLVVREGDASGQDSGPDVSSEILGLFVDEKIR